MLFLIEKISISIFLILYYGGSFKFTFKILPLKLINALDYFAIFLKNTEGTECVDVVLALLGIRDACLHMKQAPIHERHYQKNVLKIYS